MMAFWAYLSSSSKTLVFWYLKGLFFIYELRRFQGDFHYLLGHVLRCSCVTLLIRFVIVQKKIFCVYFVISCCLTLDPRVSAFYSSIISPFDYQVNSVSRFIWQYMIKYCNLNIKYIYKLFRWKCMFVYCVYILNSPPYIYWSLDF